MALESEEAHFMHHQEEREGVKGRGTATRHISWTGKKPTKLWSSPGPSQSHGILIWHRSQKSSSRGEEEGRW